MESQPQLYQRVYQHNNLIRAELHLNELEAKILIKSLQRIHQNDTGPLPPIELRIEDITPGANGKAYRLVRAACLGLFKKELSLLPPGTRSGERTYRTRILSDIDIDKGSGCVRGNFAPLIRPYLMELTKALNGEKGGYTSAEVEKLLTMKNSNSQRLYWILLSYQSLGSVQLGLDDLQGLLFEDNSPYPLWADCKRFVLDVAKKHLHDKKVDFPFSFEPIKTGKKVTAVLFVLPPVPSELKKPKQLPAPPSAPAEATTLLPTPAQDEYEAFYERLRTVYKQADWQVKVVQRYFTHAASEEQRVARFENVTSFVAAIDKKKSKDTLGGYVWSCLADKYTYLYKIKEQLYPSQN